MFGRELTDCCDAHDAFFEHKSEGNVRVASAAQLEGALCYLFLTNFRVFRDVLVSIFHGR